MLCLFTSFLLSCGIHDCIMYASKCWWNKRLKTMIVEDNFSMMREKVDIIGGMWFSFIQNNNYPKMWFFFHSKLNFPPKSICLRISIAEQIFSNIYLLSWEYIINSLISEDSVNLYVFSYLNFSLLVLFSRWHCLNNAFKLISLLLMLFLKYFKCAPGELDGFVKKHKAY